MPGRKNDETIPLVRVRSREAWRSWLEDHHRQESSVWLVLYKKGSGEPTLTYAEAVEEALCFGWVDSKSNTLDARSYKLLMSPRNPRSFWSRLNKERIERLSAQGLMAPAGLALVEQAKASGTWTALDEVEDGIIPPDLARAFREYPGSAEKFEAFPRSVKRGILEWILQARRPATRAKRIRETASLAARNIRANSYR